MLGTPHFPITTINIFLVLPVDVQTIIKIGSSISLSTSSSLSSSSSSSLSFRCRPVFRVRKYARFVVFYAKIVQMTTLRLSRESLQLQKFSVTNREPLRLQKFLVTNILSFFLTFFATNTIYINCKRCKP